MINLEFVSLAWDAVRSHKLRSTLTLLGIVIGVFAIIVAVTAVQVVETRLVNAVESFGATTFTVSRTDGFSQSSSRYRARRNLTYNDMVKYAERARLPSAVSPTMELWSPVEGRYGDRKTENIIEKLGVNEHWVSTNGFDIGQGRNMTELDVELGRDVAVIGYDIGEQLFPNINPVGKPIVIGGKRYQIVGVLAEKGDVFGSNVDILALVPITNMIQSYSAAQRNIEIKVETRSMDVIDEAMEEAIGIFRVVRNVEPGEENNFEVQSSEAFLDQVTGFTGQVKLGGAVVGLITLLSAGIGIMNIMLVSVAERTKEIGVRKAVGARRRDVLSQFLYEAIFLCQVGGITGILVGVLGGNVVGQFFDVSFVFPWGWAIGAVLGVTLIAMVFGVYPAYKAASLDPIESLRHE
ncbi:MAG: FtsX-like permease family protein [Rhodothermaceae bacterium]|nr:FtsX-like permease family protein [Rhodothermaceae bacterium]MYE62289.1 FtsX-like permease family protein [Rhodothermaceae bacterium]MYJ19553.1 FtsX-like permease family protein [Rhodothermaceae bacterium]